MISHRRRPVRLLLAAVAALPLGAALPALLATSLPAAAQAPAQRIRGTIEGVSEGGLVVRSREGEALTIALAPDAPISTVVKVDLASVGAGAYIGTAALPQADGTLKALEVLVFPEAMRGSGEGYGPWDLLPESTMTNATVAEAVQRVDGRSLVLTYKGAQKTVVVPADVPVVTFAPATRADLKPGAPVFVPAMRQADGTFKAGRVVVGRDGVAPPM